MGFFLFSSGRIISINEKIEICKITNPSDYFILTKWINKIK